MTARRRGRGSVEAQRERQQAIFEFVARAGSSSVAEIADHAHVSTMTVYRDLDDLERAGQVRLNRGMVTAGATRLHEASSRYRIAQQAEAKEALAEAAAGLVEPGSAVFLDDSSTGIPLARRLASVSPLTVISNYRPVLEVLTGEPEITLLSTGGQYLPWADAYMGPVALRAVEQMRADVAFMSASAIDEGRCFHPTAEPAEVKRAMLRSARLRVLYADHTKFARTALHHVADLAEFDVIIVDEATPAAALEGIDGPRIVRA